MYTLCIVKVTPSNQCTTHSLCLHCCIRLLSSCSRVLWLLSLLFHGLGDLQHLLCLILLLLFPIYTGTGEHCHYELGIMRYSCELQKQLNLTSSLHLPSALVNLLHTQNTRRSWPQFLSRQQFPRGFPRGNAQAMEPERREGGAGERVDISRDFCCFLCNGFVVIQGLITLQPSFVRLSTCVG